MKRICQNDECEEAHCKTCGHHYDPACGRGGECDGCIIERSMERSERETAAYGGNYEKANKEGGW